MISSKHITKITVILTFFTLLFCIIAMLFSDSFENDGFVGTTVYSDIHSVNISEDDYYSSYEHKSVSEIKLEGSFASSSSKNVNITENNIIISGGGIYELSGTLDDGCIIIDSGDSREVRLVLNGASITSSDFSAVYVKQSARTVISVVSGTINSLTDGSTYNEQETDEKMPDATLYSKDDLVINGTGTLIINANYQDGIKSKDTLKILESNISVVSADDGINANDYIAFIDSEIKITSGGDGIKCDNEKEEKGFIVFESTNLSITSEGDGVSSSSAVYLNSVTADINSGGGSSNGGTDKHGGFIKNGQSSDVPSTKGIKAGTNIFVNGGTYNIDSADDSLHSDGDITVEKGIFTISSGDDAVHSDLNLIINPETLNIKKCYEGLEGAYITINGGEISIISDDDGINATGEKSSGGVGMMRGMHFAEEKTDEEDIWLTVNGGHIYIETSGDGFDSNGSAVINGGFLEIYGPENDGDGSIDVGDGGYVLIMNGGSLLAVGSSGMAEHPTENSPQKSLAFYLEETYLSGSVISLRNTEGEEIISGTSAKKFNWICVSTEDIAEGETYTLYIDDKETANITSSGGFSSSGSRDFNTGMNSGRGKRK